MLRGAQRCSSILTRQLAGRAAAITQSQILPASLAPLAVLRATLTTEVVRAGAGPSATPFHSFNSQSIHTSVSPSRASIYDCEHGWFVCLPRPLINGSNEKN